MTLRIALVSEHASPLAVRLGTADAGGQNVYVDALARHLARVGAVRDLAAGVRVHNVSAGPPEPIPKDDLFDLMPEFARRLSDAWRWRPPDVVHAHFWMSGWASQRARRRHRVPLVQTFHALGVVKRRHQGSADTSPADRDQVERDLLQCADAVIATCLDEVSELVALGGDAAKITVVPCGVDNRFRPRPTPPHPTRVASVGRMVPRKGVADVIAAMALSCHDAELVVAGGVAGETDAETERLRAMAADLGVLNRCRFVGQLGRDAAADLMRASDVVACAPWYEPFGIVPIEAMGCGVPVVGTAVGGLLDTVVDGVTGLLVEPRRPDLLATALDELLADAARRRRMGTAGAARVDRLYRWPQVARAVLDVYHAVIAGSVHSHQRAVL
jgi:D-inositol-3-phosphate glycosyltransferase